MLDYISIGVLLLYSVGGLLTSILSFDKFKNLYKDLFAKDVLSLFLMINGLLSVFMWWPVAIYCQRSIKRKEDELEFY